MSKLSPLMIEYIDKQPLSAVKVLAEMNASDVADFFEVLPPHHAVSLLSRITAWSASSLIVEMSPAAAAAILSKLDYQTSASIMRVLPEERKSQVLEALPRKLRQALSVTLTYPANTVGAAMSVNIAVMLIDQTVGEAFTVLRQMKRTRSGVGFVVDDSQKLLGLVSAEELLLLPNESRLSDAINRSVKPLSARASLSSVMSLAAWDDYRQMPVVDRKKILIGALARRTFRQKVVEVSVDPVKRSSLLASVAGAFFSSSVGLSRVLIDLEQAADSGSSESSKGARGVRL